MGILNFFKKILKEEEKVETAINDISFSELEEFLTAKSKEVKEREKEIILIIDNRVDVFTKDLKEKIDIVKNVDIESKEKNDKIKSMVYEGRNKYILFLERLIDNLEEHKKSDNVDKLIENINYSFSRFNENSGKSYERATILIGKEMGSIRETLKKFSKDILEIFNENKENLSFSKKINLIKSKIKENEDINIKLNQIDEEIEIIKSKIKIKEKEKKENLEKLENIKNSKEHIKDIELQKAILSQEEEIKREVSELRQIIDFKALSNFFHIFESKMETIKSYKDNFSEEFKRDKASKLLILLDESKLNNERVYNKIKEIENKENLLNKNRKELKEDETKNISTRIESINEDIRNITHEKEGVERRKYKLNENKITNLEEIKKELNSINIKVKEE